jgi:toxin ParE1/3/4
MIYRFLDDARSELIEAQDFYDSREIGLGNEFHAAVATSIQNLLAAPYRSPRISRNARRYLIKRFPYSIIYQVCSTEILILSVFHLSRRPGSWRNNR